MTDITMQAHSSASNASKWWKSIKEWLFRDRTSIDQASYCMLRLYRTNLEVRLRTIDESSLQSDSQKRIHAAVVEMLKAPPKDSAAATNFEWDEMNKVESLIALMLSGPQLRQEISARLQELAEESLAEANGLRREYEVLLKPPGGGSNQGSDDAIFRAFLLRVMEAIHWRAKKKYLARPIRKEATRILLFGVLISFLAMVAPYVILNFGFAYGSNGLPSKFWSLFALYTALTAGLLGAFFSQLYSVQRHWTDMTLEEVFSHREILYTLLRAGVGMCGALIVYFFLRSGIAEGALFPKFADVKIQYISVADTEAVQMAFVMPSKDLALLTFWCFLAGFSEALVPKMLSGTEKQLADASTQAQPRRK